MPLGPYIRCAVHERRSMPIASTFTGIFPTACVASVWKRTPLALQSLPIAATSWIVPISLLANITETRIVLSVIALTICSTSIRPSGCTGTYVTSEPCRSRRLATSRPARCSMTVVTMWFPFSRYISATPLRARLIDSVPPDVNTISFGSRAPISVASWLRAVSTAASASHPKGWFRLAGWPYFWVKYGSIASTTRGSAGVVDCASMNIGNVTAIARLSLRSSISGHFTARLATGGAQPARAARAPRLALLEPFHRSPRSDRACGNSRAPRLALPNREQLGHVIGHQLGQTHRVQHLADRDLDLLHRPPQVAARHLRAITVAFHALHDVDRALEHPHHLSYRDLSRPPREHVAAFRPVPADDQPLPCQPLEDLGQELGRDPELVRDPLSAHRAVVLVDSDVMDSHQPVVGTLGEAQHHVLPLKGDSLSRRPFQSESTPKHRDVKQNPAETGKS